MELKLASRNPAFGYLIIAFLSLLTACDDTQSVDHIQRAQEFLDGGRPNGAVVELKQLLQDDPRNGEARRLLGTTYARLGNFTYAEKELRRAKELDPQSAVIAIELAQIWSRQGAYSKLTQELEARDNWPQPEQIAAHLMVANAHMALGDLDAAEQSFQRVRMIEPKNVTATVGLVRITVRRGNREEIEKTLARALEIAPDNSRLLGFRAGIAFRDKNYEAAEAIFRAKLAVAPESLSTRLGLAQALLAQGEMREAKIEIDRVLARSPGHPSAHYLSAVIAMQNGNYPAARSSSLRALAAKPNHEPSLFLAGVSSHLIGRPREARWHLENLLRRSPDYPAVHPILAAAKQRIAEEDAKQAHLRRKGPILFDDLALFRLGGNATAASTPTAGINAEDSRKAIQQGVAALREERHAEAVDIFRETFIQELDPDAALWLALAHRRSGQPAKAYRTLENWLARHADDAKARRVLADLYLLSADVEQALPHLRALVKDDPREVAALNNMAWIQVQLGNPREAIPLAKRALALAPTDARVMDTLGLALLQNGDN